MTTKWGAKKSVLGSLASASVIWPVKATCGLHGRTLVVGCRETRVVPHTGGLCNHRTTNPLPPPSLSAFGLMVVVQVQTVKTKSDNWTFALREGWWKDIGGCTSAFSPSCSLAQGARMVLLTRLSQYKIQLESPPRSQPRSSAKQADSSADISSSGHILFI